MVNLVAAQKPLLYGLMKVAGVVPHAVEIQQGTTMRFWVPSETIKKGRNKGSYEYVSEKVVKPVVVLIHGFAAEGIVTWQFQVGALTKKYSVFVPDLLFFGGSMSDSPERSVKFQAECLVKGLRKLGVKSCTLVGFSYGGMVAFKMAEMFPEFVKALVVSGSSLDHGDCKVENLGFESPADLLLPTTVKNLKTLFQVATHKNIWFPERLHRDYLEVMFNNRKEKAELLQYLSTNTEDNTKIKFPHKIHLLWGGNDLIFNLEIAQKLKRQLGENATLQGIEKAGHLVHLERPCVYNRCLKQFLATIHVDETKN